METAFFVEILRGLLRKTNSTVQTRRSLPTSGMDEPHNRCRFWKTLPACLAWVWEVGVASGLAITDYCKSVTE
jgi:hypothetical protein